MQDYFTTCYIALGLLYKGIDWFVIDEMLELIINKSFYLFN